MICFRDKTYCLNAYECVTEPCDRRITDEQLKQAEKLGLAVCYVGLKNECKEFKERK